MGGHIEGGHGAIYLRRPLCSILPLERLRAMYLTPLLPVAESEGSSDSRNDLFLVLETTLVVHPISSLRCGSSSTRFSPSSDPLRNLPNTTEVVRCR